MNKPHKTSDVMPEVLEKYQLAALPTTHGGIVYRSRLEARWAIFFDTLNLQFEYEKEGFSIGGLCYLPDFWLPQLDFWFEVKGPEPNDDECEKAHRLAVATGKDVFVAFGGHSLPNSSFGPPKHHAFFANGGGDCDYLWCECPQCHAVGIEYEGRSDRLPCKECHQCWTAREDGGDHVCELSNGCKRTGGNGDKGYATDGPRLMEAYRRARGMRFGR